MEFKFRKKDLSLEESFKITKKKNKKFYLLTNTEKILFSNGII